ncbi:MAG: hypothetical protein GY859_20380 [Desulfobacterales bacterium]|nr:hypothetical protein [Desulfobacterales bacterium]
MQERGVELRIQLESIGFKDSVVDLYVLKNNPEEIRARMKKTAAPTGPGAGEADLKEAPDLKEIQKALQEGVLGVATIEEFHSFGRRGDEYIFYSRVIMEDEPADVIQQQVFAEQAISDIRGVDSKTFRKGLDIVKLPRSSLVRMALTRLFRNSMDAPELAAAAIKEAELITDAAEREILKELRENNSIPFLTNLIHLLWDEISKKP